MPFYPSGRGPEDRSGIYIQSYGVRISKKVVISPVCYIHSSARWRHTFLSPFLAANRSLAVPILYGDTPPCDSWSGKDVETNTQINECDIIAWFNVDMLCGDKVFGCLVSMLLLSGMDITDVRLAE